MASVLDEVSDVRMRRGVKIYFDWIIGVQAEYKEHIELSENTIERKIWEAKLQTISNCVQYLDKVLSASELSDRLGNDM